MATIHPQDRVTSLVAVSARAGAMLSAYAALVVLVPVTLIVITFGGTPLSALPAALGRPLFVVLATGVVFGTSWFVAYGTLWILDRRTTLLEPDRARPHFEAHESIVREGIGAFQTTTASRLGKLIVTTTRVRFRAFRIGGRPVDESIALGLIASARVVHKRVGGLRAGHLLLTLHGGETRAFYGYDEASWRDAVGDALTELRGAS